MRSLVVHLDHQDKGISSSILHPVNSFFFMSHYRDPSESSHTRPWRSQICFELIVIHVQPEEPEMPLVGKVRSPVYGLIAGKS